MADETCLEMRELLKFQRGVITRPQALQVDMTREGIAMRLRSGRWQRLHQGVYATFSGQPERLAVLWAAVLRAGTEAALSHQTAAELHGLLSPSTGLSVASGSASVPMIHITVPRGSQVSRIAGVTLHYSQRIRDARHPMLSPPQTRVEDTVLDLSQTAASLDSALGWIFRACGSRRTTADRLRLAMDLRRRMRWRSEFSAALRDAGDGVHSLLEYRYLNRVERPHGLPRGTRQAAAEHGGRRRYRDVDYEEYRTLVELDGRAAHPEEDRWSDIRRDNASTAERRATLRYGWPDVTDRPCEVATAVAVVLRQRGWTGAPIPCAPTCAITGSIFTCYIARKNRTRNRWW